MHHDRLSSSKLQHRKSASLNRCVAAALTPYDMTPYAITNVADVHQDKLDAQIGCHDAVQLSRKCGPSVDACKPRQCLCIAPASHFHLGFLRASTEALYNWHTTDITVLLPAHHQLLHQPCKLPGYGHQRLDHCIHGQNLA